MIHRYAIIETNKVVNVILLDSLNFENFKNSSKLTDDTLIMLEEDSMIGIGWSYYEGNFVNEMPVSSEVIDVDQTINSIINQVSNT